MSNGEIEVNGLVPAFLEVEVAGVICDWSRQQSFERLWRGELPATRFGRRWAVPVVQLEMLIGRAITAADIQRAKKVVQARKMERRTAQSAQVA